jgi:hypothetical protein
MVYYFEVKPCDSVNTFSAKELLTSFILIYIRLTFHIYIYVYCNWSVIIVMSEIPISRQLTTICFGNIDDNMIKTILLTIKIQLSEFVWYKAEHIIISLKICSRYDIVEKLLSWRKAPYHSILLEPL